MKTEDKPNQSKQLRAAIRIEEGKSTPILLQGAELPAEAIHVIPNTLREKPDHVRKFHSESPSTQELLARMELSQMGSVLVVCLFFGDNEESSDNVSLGVFSTQLIRPVSSGGPPQISIKISVSAEQEVCVSILDPSSTRYRSIAFINISNIDPPAIVPPSPDEPIVVNLVEVFDLFFGDSQKQRHIRQPRSGKDTSYNLSISFNDALHGAQKHIEVQGSGTCPECTGTGIQPGTSPVECGDCQGTGERRIKRQTKLGEMISISPCPTCNGTGETIPDSCINCQGKGQVVARYPLAVNVPAGIDSGAQICMLQQGEPGQNKGRSGNLYITVTVTDHPFFTRVGREVFIHLPVSAHFAKKGGLARVPGVEKDSFFYLDLPPDTQSGTALWVCKSESHSLIAQIETYNPHTLVLTTDTKKHLQEIREVLGDRNLEVDEEAEEVLECDKCGAPVDAATQKCPYCGEVFED